MSDGLPRNADAEFAVLGSIMANNDAMRHCGGLKPEHFGDAFLGDLYAEIQTRVNMGSVASPVTLKDWAISRQELADLGGPGVLAKMAAAAVAVFNVADYARVVIENASRRAIILACKTAIESARAAGDPQHIAAALDTTILAQDYSGGMEHRSFEQSMLATAKRVSDAFQADGKPTGVLTGIHAVDRITGGFKRGNLVVVAGRPSMGKSAFAASVALTAARMENPFHIDEPKKTGVIVVTMEMPEDEYCIRMTSDMMRRDGMRVPYQHAMSGFIDRARRDPDEEERAIMQWMEFIKGTCNLPVTIVDLASPSLPLMLSMIRTRAAYLESIGAPVGLIVVDHIGLVAKADGRENETTKIGKITGAMKGLAKRMGCAVMILSQLNRAVESRDDKRPKLSDLRESGNIEQDADMVLFPFRPSYYLELEPPDEGTHEHLEWRDSLDHWRNRAQVIVAKNRSGPKGIATIGCEIEYNYFEDEPR